MNNTDKILAEFDEKFPDHGFDNNAENEFHSALIRRFLIAEIAEAIAEERKRLVDEAKDFIKDVKLSPAQFERFINWIFINS